MPPPWGGRFFSASSRNEGGSNSVGGSSPSRTRITESDILENALGIPTLSPPPSANYGAANTSRPARSPGHGRSMSHPFPSLFSSKKKRIGEHPPASGFESTDDDSTSPVAIRSTPLHPSAKHKVLDKDLMCGKCMTCDAMVRWPKELGVFRCTQCLTINDLKPVVLEVSRPDGHRSPVLDRTGQHTASRFQYTGTSGCVQKNPDTDPAQFLLFPQKGPRRSLTNVLSHTS